MATERASVDTTSMSRSLRASAEKASALRAAKKNASRSDLNRRSMQFSGVAGRLAGDDHLGRWVARPNRRQRGDDGVEALARGHGPEVKDAGPPHVRFPTC